MREESAKESAESRLRAGLRQGLRRCFFPHHFPPVSPFWVDHNLDDVKLSVQIPAALLRNPCSPRALSNKPPAALCRHISPKLLTLTSVSATDPTRPELRSFRIIDASRLDTSTCP